MTQNTYGHRGVFGSSRILLLRDDQAISHLTLPFNAHGKRKIPPTPEELKVIDAENQRRADLLNEALNQWDKQGSIESELRLELEAISPAR